MSFQLIDRIETFEPGKKASGRVRTPSGPGEFPLCLVVEAVGQLAGYIAMEHVDFSQLPVAAIAGRVTAMRSLPAGSTLELSISVRSLRSGAIRYDGVACVDGEPYVEVQRFTGFMLPLEDFDDPARVRARFQHLRGEGIAPRKFPARNEFASRIDDVQRPRPGQLQAVLETPPEAPFYADHFPRRAVYPATLLLDSKIGLAQRLLAEENPHYTTSFVRGVHDVKIRAFTPPGGRVSVTAQMEDVNPETTTRTVQMQAFADETRISSAKAILDVPQA